MLVGVSFFQDARDREPAHTMSICIIRTDIEVVSIKWAIQVRTDAAIRQRPVGVHAHTAVPRVAPSKTRREERRASSIEERVRYL